MGKLVHNDVLDAAWDVIKDNCNLQILCSEQPTSRATALSLALASVVMATEDFTISDGDVSGRKLVVAAKTNVTIDVTGSGTHIALCDSTRLLYVTIAPAQAVVQGIPRDFPAWRAELADPI